MSAWKRLLADQDWCRGRHAFPLPAYSEMMPPPWVAMKPYPHLNEIPSPQSGEHGWIVTEYEEEQELLPGLEFLARGLLAELIRLGKGESPRYLTRERLRNNPCWPTELARHAGRLHHERYVLLTTLALSRTQDDKGRVPWTFFGASEQGPGKGFWRGFFTGPGQEIPFEKTFFADLLSRCYGLSDRASRDPGRAGLRILSMGRDRQFPYWNEGPFPSWAMTLQYRPRDGLDGVKWLLTFRPFEQLPADVQNAYVEGKLHLLPFPGSLVFWHMPGFRTLAKQLKLAMQLPLSFLFARRNDPHGMRIPQAGYLNEKIAPHEGDSSHRPVFVRTHRWQKVLRHQDEATLIEMADAVTRVLFSTDPDDISLYNKPMARNVQIWTRKHRLLLDGLTHGERRITRAEAKLAEGGTFGYRFIFPPMRVGLHEVYWHRPVTAFAGEQTDDPATSVQMLRGPTGYLTAYHVDRPDLARPIELWPVFPNRPPQRATIELYRQEVHPRRWQTTSNLRALLEWRELLDEPLTASMAQALMAIPERQTLEEYLAALPARATDPFAAHTLVNRLSRSFVRKREKFEPGRTFPWTASRQFEEDYWRTIATLAHGRYLTKCNADCIRDEPSRAALHRRRRDLDLLADYLLECHHKVIQRSGVEGAWVGEHRFSWRTDFDFDWMGGWVRSQRKRNQERNLIVRIPGRNSREVVILADHYDTAYMHDRYYLHEGGTGARVAAAGADDNHSATAMLLLAAPIFLELSKAGLLGCDVWLVHLTGEEFPADCLGARHLSQDLVQGTLRAKQHGGPVIDLSECQVRGVYVCDMIAHNNQRDKYDFQIAPGEGKGSARLAKIAHQTNLAWNEHARSLNDAGERRKAGPPMRSDDPDRIPPVCPHATLRGEIRPEWEPRSTLFNTDGQIFSDVGVSVVLFMEDYDINRKGYHDTHDTMANIDLDYGAALAAIAIESTARAAQ